MLLVNLFGRGIKMASNQTWWEWLNHWMSQSSSDWFPLAWAMDNNPILIGVQVVGGAVLAVTFLTLALGIMYQGYLGGYLDKNHRLVTLFFASFLAMCGLTFIAREVVIFVPLYWVYGAVKTVTAIFAVLTLITYVKLFSAIKEYPTPKEYLALKAQKKDLERKEARLNKHIKAWTDDVGEHIQHLKKQHTVLANDLTSKGLPVTLIDDSLHKSVEPMSKDEALDSLEKIKKDLDTLMQNINDKESN